MNTRIPWLLVYARTWQWFCINILENAASLKESEFRTASVGKWTMGTLCSLSFFEHANPKKTISTQPNAWKIDPRCTWNNGTKKNNNNSKCPENLHQEQTPYLTFSWKSSRRPRFPVHRVVYATCESHVRNYTFPLLENVYVLCLINDKCLFCYFCSVFVCCSLFCRCHLARDFLVSQGCGIFCHVTCFRLFF